ncbi:hypothetical protein ACOSQ3_032808 [Xanthoceras sorbifolium]
MLYKILLTEDSEENYRENHLDECSVNKFVAKNIGNPGVVFKKFKTNKSLQALNIVRSVENNYLLVGKLRGPHSRLEQEMNPWVDYKELGVIGDMLATSYFGGGLMSILVMHSIGDVNDSSSISFLDDIMAPLFPHHTTLEI